MAALAADLASRRLGREVYVAIASPMSAADLDSPEQVAPLLSSSTDSFRPLLTGVHDRP